VRLLTREALTHEPPPPSARRVVELWRPWLEGKIGRDITELDRAILDLARRTPDDPALPPLTAHYHNLIRKWSEV